VGRESGPGACVHEVCGVVGYKSRFELDCGSQYNLMCLSDNIVMSVGIGGTVGTTLQVRVGICITQLLSSLIRSFCQSSEDAVMFTTAYLTLFLTHISNVSLMREFLRYITLGQVDGRRVLNTLTINISSSNNKARVYSHSRPSVETRLVSECSLHESLHCTYMYTQERMMTSQSQLQLQ